MTYKSLPLTEVLKSKMNDPSFKMACEYAGLKPNFDHDEEIYHQFHKIEILLAFLNGVDFGKTEFSLDLVESIQKL